MELTSPPPRAVFHERGKAAGLRKLTKEELRRCDAVLDVAVGAASLPELLLRTLEALDEHLGIGRSAFLLALNEGGLPGPRAYGGVDHGHPEYVLEEYFERWPNRDALVSAAGRESYRRTGRAAVGELYGRLDPPRRDYVDSFLRRIGEPEQVSFRLPGAWSDVYLTVAALPDELPVQHLLPTLGALLRARLPRGVEAGLTRREGEVSELVALGFTNREIAGILHIEEDTVKKHVSRAMGRVGVAHRTQLAVAWATGAVMTVPG